MSKDKVLDVEKFKEINSRVFIPEEIIDIVNETILEKGKGGYNAEQGYHNSITIRYEELINKICAKLAGTLITLENGNKCPFKKEYLFEHHWLDFEYLYREKRWNIFFLNPNIREIGKPEIYEGKNCQWIIYFPEPAYRI